jgi:hypothetical protein
MWLRNKTPLSFHPVSEEQLGMCPAGQVIKDFVEFQRFVKSISDILNSITS